jgi:hypothetical protein
MDNLFILLPPEWAVLYASNMHIWGAQHEIVRLILGNLTAAQNCIPLLNDLSTSIGSIQALPDINFEQTQQLHNNIQSFNFQKFCFHTHLRNNIVLLDSVARENPEASRILSQIPANIFRLSRL